MLVRHVPKSSVQAPEAEPHLPGRLKGGVASHPRESGKGRPASTKKEEASSPSQARRGRASLSV